MACDAEDIVEERGIYRFHRGACACAMSKTREHVFWGHIGLDEDNPHHGKIFVKLGGVAVYRMHMPVTGNAAWDRRWWLGFEGSKPYSFRSTMEELARAADQASEQHVTDTWPDGVMQRSA